MMERLSDDAANIQTLLPWIEDKNDIIHFLRRVPIDYSHLRIPLSISYFLNLKDESEENYERKLEEDAMDIVILLPDAPFISIKNRLQDLGNIHNRKEVVVRQILKERPDLKYKLQEIDVNNLRKRCSEGMDEHGGNNETNIKIKIRKIDGSLEVVSSIKQEILASPKKPNGVPEFSKQRSMEGEMAGWSNSNHTTTQSSTSTSNISITTSFSELSKQLASTSEPVAKMSNDISLEVPETFNLLEYLKDVTQLSEEKIRLTCFTKRVSLSERPSEAILDELLNKLFNESIIELDDSDSEKETILKDILCKDISNNTYKPKQLLKPPILLVNKHKHNSYKTTWEDPATHDKRNYIQPPKLTLPSTNSNPKPADVIPAIPQRFLNRLAEWENSPQETQIYPSRKPNETDKWWEELVAKCYGEIDSSDAIYDNSKNSVEQVMLVNNNKEPSARNEVSSHTHLSELLVEPFREREPLPGPSREQAVLPGPSGQQVVLPGPSGQEAVVPEPSKERLAFALPSQEQEVVPGPSGVANVLPESSAGPYDLSLSNIFSEPFTGLHTLHFPPAKKEKVEKLTYDERLVIKIMEMFPEACPDYIKDICRGKKFDHLDDVITILLSQETYPKRQQRAPSPPKEYDMEEQLEIVKALLPEADPTFLRWKCETIGNNPEGLNEFINEARELPNYPTMKEYLRKQKLSAQSKQYTSDFNVKHFVDLFPDPEKTFRDPARKYTVDNYTHLYICNFFQNRYDKLAVRHIRATLAKNANRILLSDDQMHYFVLKGICLKTRRKHVVLQDPPTNITVLQELAYLQHKTEIDSYIKETKEREEQEKQEAKENGLLNTCQCCYDDEVMPKDTFCCPNGCMFCKGCIQKSCEVSLGDGKTNFKCLNDCSEEFELYVLQKVLPPKMFSKLAQKKALAEVKAAGIEELESCPFCDFASIPNPQDKIFRCLNPDCMKESCRLCKEENHVPYKCDEVEKDEDVKARVFVENQMTEALLRKCWRCSKSFFKEEGCNKMTCNCGAQMCYVCRQPVKDYSHFNGIGGDKHHLCPLYSDTNALNEANVIKAAEEAKAKVDPSKLKIDPSTDVKQHYEQRKTKLPQEPHLRALEEVRLMEVRLQNAPWHRHPIGHVRQDILRVPEAREGAEAVRFRPLANQRPNPRRFVRRDQ